MKNKILKRDYVYISPKITHLPIALEPMLASVNVGENSKTVGIDDLTEVDTYNW